MVRATRSALTLMPDLAEWIDPAQKQRAEWPDWRDAAVHEPTSLAELSATNPARERLAMTNFLPIN